MLYCGRNSEHEYILQGQQIKAADNFFDLGIWFSVDGGFSSMISLFKICVKLSSSIFTISHTFLCWSNKIFDCYILLGPSDQEDSCATCGQNSQFCPGHIGHISLPLPVYNPILFRLLLQVKFIYYSQNLHEYLLMVFVR